MQNGLGSKMLSSLEDHTFSHLAVILHDCCRCLDFFIIQRIIGDLRVSGRIFFVTHAKLEKYYFLTTQVAKEKKLCHYCPCTSLLMRAASAMSVVCVLYLGRICVPTYHLPQFICISIIWCCTLHTLSYVKHKERQTFCSSIRRSMSLKP